MRPRNFAYGMRFWIILVPLVLILAIFLAACGEDDTPTPRPTSASIPSTPIPPTATAIPPTATAVPPTATAVPPTATAVPPTATAIPPTATAVPPTPTAIPPTPTPTTIPITAGDVLLIALGEQNDSGQTGWAKLTAMGDQTEVMVTLMAGTMESELIHIHSGSCGDNLGGVVYGLTSIADGVSVTTVNANLASLRAGGMAINSHQKDNAGVYTTCGNIPIEADALTIALDEQIMLIPEQSTGQSGWATLTARGSKTEVVLYLPAGALESELVHIHSGSCGTVTLGGVVYSLTNVASGASMTTVDATLASLRMGNMAINAHQKGAPAVYTACGNIPAGQAMTLLIALGEQNDSGQTGWATLTAKGDQTVVVVNLMAGAMESELIHIHAGSCGTDTLLGVVYSLTNIAGGVSVTTVDATLASLQAGDMAINSHQKDNAGVYTTCGNIPIEADAVTIALGEQNSSGQSGWATLTGRGSNTEVVLSISPGAMESELLHIHSGTCDNPIGVIYGLTSIAGGASVSTLNATLASLTRTGILAINSHQKGKPTIHTACGNIQS